MKLEELICQNKDIDLDKYIAFRDEVKKTMEHPEWLGDFTKDEITEILKNGGKLWVYFQKDEPVCSMMLIPASPKSIEKFELDLDYKDVADYGPMFVAQKFRGHKLQYQMLKELDNYILKYGYHHAAATIHPDNIYSINNLLKDDFTYTITKEFKRGIRNIYYKKLESNIQVDYSFNAEEFAEVLTAVGWDPYPITQAKKALQNSMHLLKVTVDNKLAGIGRIVGDGISLCVMTNICVKPEYQNKGIGSIIVLRLKNMVTEDIKEGEKIKIQITPVAGLEPFYQQFGFKYKPKELTGMWKWIKK